jgi:signal transduction histidine kinase
VEHLTRTERAGAVATAAAHDLNNELTVILSSVNESLERLGPTHPAHAMLLDLRRAAQRCAWMTNDLLNYGARKGVHPSPTPLQALLHG